MSFYAYLLRCGDGSLYVGHTDDLDRRLAQHASGEAGGYTSSRRPITPLWAQEFSTREEAFACERQVKGWSRAKKLALAKEDWSSLHLLARSSERRSRDEARESIASAQTGLGADEVTVDGPEQTGR